MKDPPKVKAYLEYFNRQIKYLNNNDGITEDHKIKDLRAKGDPSAIPSQREKLK